MQVDGAVKVGTGTTGLVASVTVTAGSGGLTVAILGSAAAASAGVIGVGTVEAAAGTGLSANAVNNMSAGYGYGNESSGNGSSSDGEGGSGSSSSGGGDGASGGNNETVGPNSQYDDITTSSRGKSAVTNKQTNVSQKEFGDNLENSGFNKDVKGGGKATVYSKDGQSYTVRSAKDGTPTADFRKDANNKKTDIKIRLKK